MSTETKSIYAEFFWAEMPGEGRPCDACKDEVYGKLFYPVMQLGAADKLNFSDVDVKICQSCRDRYEAIKNTSA